MVGKRAPDHDQRRAEIRDTGLRLMAEGGVQAAAMESIAAALCQPMARVQYYYRSREKLLDDVVNLHMDALLTSTATDEIAALPDADRLHALAAAYTAAIANDTLSHRATVYYLAYLSPQHQASVRTRMRWLAYAFVGALAEAAPDLPARHAKPLALSLLAMLNAQAVWFREGGGMLREDCTAMAVRMVLAEAGVLPRRGAPGDESRRANARAAHRTDTAIRAHPEPTCNGSVPTRASS